MSLVFNSEFAPVDIGGEGKEIPHCLPCPVCPAGRLQRHDHYLRRFEGKEIRIEVLKCSVCGTSQACLFDFLVPGSRHSSAELGEHAARYICEEEKSYEQAGWEASEEEGESCKSVIFRSIERLCEKVEWITQYVEKRRLRPGESLWKRKEPEPEDENPNVRRARSAEKRKALNQLRTALAKYMQFSGQKVAKAIEELHRASMLLTAPFSLLSGMVRRKLSAPKKMRYGIM